VVYSILSQETPTYAKATQTDATSTPLEEEPKLNVSGLRLRGGRYKQTKEEEGEGEANNATTATETTKTTGEGEEGTKEAEVPELPG
jgi:hypothetical protein